MRDAHPGPYDYVPFALAVAIVVSQIATPPPLSGIWEVDSFVRGHDEGHAGAVALPRLHRLDETKFLLVSRGYHWINEFPLNR